MSVILQSLPALLPSALLLLLLLTRRWWLDPLVVRLPNFPLHADVDGESTTDMDPRFADYVATMLSRHWQLSPLAFLAAAVVTALLFWPAIPFLLPLLAASGILWGLLYCHEMAHWLIFRAHASNTVLPFIYAPGPAIFFDATGASPTWVAAGILAGPLALLILPLPLLAYALGQGPTPLALVVGFPALAVWVTNGVNLLPFWVSDASRLATLSPSLSPLARRLFHLAWRLMVATYAAMMIFGLFHWGVSPLLILAACVALLVATLPIAILSRPRPEARTGDLAVPGASLPA